MEIACHAKLDAECAVTPIFHFVSAVLLAIWPTQPKDAQPVLQIASPVTSLVAYLAPKAISSVLTSPASNNALFPVCNAPGAIIPNAPNVLTATRSQKVSAKPTNLVMAMITAPTVHWTPKCPLIARSPLSVKNASPAVECVAGAVKTQLISVLLAFLVIISWMDCVLSAWMHAIPVWVRIFAHLAILDMWHSQELGRIPIM